MNVIERLDPPVVAVVRAPGMPDPRRLVEAFLSAGVRGVEFTLTTPGALAAAAACRDSEAAIGVGTVLDREQAERAIAAGAEFLVAPTLEEEVIECGEVAGVPVVPGAFTPNEIQASVLAGAAIVKLFPAYLASPAYVSDLRTVMPDARLMPSGGISPENPGAFLRAGAIAVSSGSATAPPGLVAAGDYAEIERRARDLVAAVAQELA